MPRETANINTAADDYMNEAQCAHFTQILSNWQAQLLQENLPPAHTLAIGAENDADPMDRATRVEELHMEVRTQDRRRRLASKIASSIQLIAHGDYGYCDTCGSEIGLQRLEARPTATQCIDCKSLDELKERQVRG